MHSTNALFGVLNALLVLAFIYCKVVALPMKCTKLETISPSASFEKCFEYSLYTLMEFMFHVVYCSFFYDEPILIKMEFELNRN
jgi:hypothetical protein